MEKTFNKIIQYCLYLLIFLLPIFFLPFSLEAFEFNKYYLLYFLVSLGFLAWLAKMILVEKEIHFKFSPFDLFIIVFLGLAILSSIFSVDKISSIFGFYGRFSNGFITLLSLVIFYFLIINNISVNNAEPVINNKEKEKSGQKPLITVGSLFKVFIWSVFFIILISYLSIFGFWQKISGFTIFNFQLKLPPIMLQRPFNPIAGSFEGLAVFLSVFLVFLIGLLLFQKIKNKFKKIIHWLLFFSILGLLVIIDFNSAWITLLGSLTLFSIFALWKRIFKENVNKLLLPIFLIIVAVFFLVTDTSKLFQGQFFQLPKEIFLNQGQSWIVGLKSATDDLKSGFLGSGLGTFHYDFSKFRAAQFNQTDLWQIRFDRAGNYFAELLATLGFLGFIAYLVLLSFFLLVSYFLVEGMTKSPGKEKSQNYQLIFLMVFLALITSQFVYYQNLVLAFVFWLVLAVAVVYWQKPLKEKKFSFKNFPELSLVFNIFFLILVLAFLSSYFFAGRFYLADVFYQRAFVSDFIPNLERAVKLNPYQPSYKIILARAYLNKILAETEEKDISSLTDSINTTINQVKGGEIDGRYQKGATELAPNWVAGWETMGMIYREFLGMGSASEWAKKSFEKAVELEPTNPVFYTELGKLSLAENNISSAKEQFAKASSLKPDYFDLLKQEAKVAEMEENIDEAIKKTEEMVVVSPFDTETRFQLGRLYFNQGRVDEAIIQFENAILLMPNYSNAHYALGLAYEKKGEIDLAIAEFEKVLDLNPGNEEIKNKLEELRMR